MMKLKEKFQKLVTKVNISNGITKLALGVAVASCLVGIVSMNTYAEYADVDLAMSDSESQTASISKDFKAIYSNSGKTNLKQTEQQHEDDLASTNVSSLSKTKDVSSKNEDNNGPKAEIKRDGNTFTITAIDNQDGLFKMQELDLWKIQQLDSSGTVIAETNFEPSDITSNLSKPIDLDGEALKVRVCDSKKNYTTLDVTPLEVSSDTSISADQAAGIKITADCTLTFRSGTTGITIGSSSSTCPGIEIAASSVTIRNYRSGGVTICGGTRTTTDGSTIRYAGIYVPSGKTLTINGSGIMYAYGYCNANKIEFGTGAGIGGNGITPATTSTDISQLNSGTINIESGTITAIGGMTVKGFYGTGAGIGGGGLYNTVITSDKTGGCVEAVSISGGTVTVYGGYPATSETVSSNGTGAGIGGGGVYNTAGGTLTGGKLTNISISNGTITAYAGSGQYDDCGGSGAGIGGGGIYNRGASTVVGGKLENFEMTGGTINSFAGNTRSKTNATKKMKGSGAGIGGGGIANYTATSVTGGDLENFSISAGTILNATGGCGSYNTSMYGGGAGIGGGGIYDETATSKLEGGKAAIISITGTATIGIDENGISGAVGGYSHGDGTYGGGAGIGGGGVYSKVASTITGGSLATSIRIEGTGIVKAYGGYVLQTDQGNVYGSGAGIGGGGIYSNDASTIIGGNLEQVIFNGSKTVTAQGGFADWTNINVYGSGAGIGGGGIYSKVASTIIGGNLEQAIFNGSNTIIAQGGCVSNYANHNNRMYGSGAGIGGGGISYGGSTANIIELGGKLTKLDITNNTTTITATAGNGTTTYGTGAAIGGGGIANLSVKVTGTITKGGLGTVLAYNYNSNNITATQATTSYGQGAQVGEGGVYNYGTNISGDEFTIETTIDETEPEASGFYGNGKIKITARDTESGLWKITATDDPTETDIDIENSSFIQNNEWGTRVITSDLTTVYVFDNVGNSKQVNLVQDTAAPTIETNYDDGILTLTVSDPAGVAIIDSETYTDCEPSKSITISPDKTEVYVEDVLGNYDTLEIGTMVPKITKAFKKGQDVIVGAKYQGIALCKVSESYDFNNTDTDTLFTNTETEILQVTLSDENVTTLYVYDVQGNAAEIDLTDENIIDTAPPTYVGPTYVNGDIKLFVTDEKAGLKSINGSTTGYTNYPTTAQEYIVPANVQEVILVDALDNSTAVPIDRTLPQISNIYVTDGGKTMITASDASGIYAVKYYVTGEDPQTVVISGSPTTTQIEIPENINNIGVIDAFGNESPLNLADISKPTIQNMYKKGINVYSVETSGITEIYCKNPTKQVLVANPQAVNTFTLPQGVTTIYVTDTNHNEVGINISADLSTVNKAIIYTDGTKMMVNITGTKTITNITYQDANGDALAGNLEVLATEVSGVKDIPNGAVSFKLNYSDETSLRIYLQQNDGPKLVNTVMLEDGRKLVTVGSMVGIARIYYKGENDVVHELEIDGTNPTTLVQELDLSDEITTIYVEDIFGETLDVSIEQEDMQTNIQDMATNGDGSTVFLNLSSEKVITKIEYIDDQNIAHGIDIAEDITEFKRGFDTVGAQRIVITYADGQTSEVELIVDASTPSNDETVMDTDGENYKTELQDNRGIRSIQYGEQVVTQGLEDYPKNVILELKKVYAQGLSLGSKVKAMDDNGTPIITITSDEDDDDIIVTNAVNTSQTLSLLGATIDDTDPEASVQCEDDYFVLTATDEESGILRVVGKQTGKVIFTPDGCPATFRSPQTAYPAGDNALIVQNGVGKTTEVSLEVGDIRPPQILWAYKNLERNYIYLVVTDESVIGRIEDEDGNVRMVFEG